MHDHQGRIRFEGCGQGKDSSQAVRNVTATCGTLVLHSPRTFGMTQAIQTVPSVIPHIMALPALVASAQVPGKDGASDVDQVDRLLRSQNG